MAAITSLGASTIPIGELSRLTGVNIETIVYYERITMLPAPPRTEGGRRVYGQIQVQTLKFIRRSRKLGFTLDEIRNLLGLAEGDYACGEVKAAAVAHLPPQDCRSSPDGTHTRPDRGPVRRRTRNTPPNFGRSQRMTLPTPPTPVIHTIVATT
jgi:MerR family mercuric resistance operon transcriptional regulator